MLRLIRTHTRLKATLNLPIARDLLEAPPKSNRQSCKVGRAKSGCLSHSRTHDRDAKQVCLKLHEKIIHARATVDAQLGEHLRRIALHCYEQFSALERDGFDGGARDMRPRAAA